MYLTTTLCCYLDPCGTKIVFMTPHLCPRHSGCALGVKLSRPVEHHRNGLLQERLEIFPDTSSGSVTMCLSVYLHYCHYDGRQPSLINPDANFVVYNPFEPPTPCDHPHTERFGHNMSDCSSHGPCCRLEMFNICGKDYCWWSTPYHQVIRPEDERSIRPVSSEDVIYLIQRHPEFVRILIRIFAIGCKLFRLRAGRPLSTLSEPLGEPELAPLLDEFCAGSWEVLCRELSGLAEKWYFPHPIGEHLFEDWPLCPVLLNDFSNLALPGLNGHLRRVTDADRFGRTPQPGLAPDGFDPGEFEHLSCDDGSPAEEAGTTDPRLLTLHAVDASPAISSGQPGVRQVLRFRSIETVGAGTDSIERGPGSGTGDPSQAASAPWRSPSPPIYEKEASWTNRRWYPQGVGTPTPSPTASFTTELWVEEQLERELVRELAAAPRAGVEARPTLSAASLSSGAPAAPVDCHQWLAELQRELGPPPAGPNQGREITAPSTCSPLSSLGIVDTPSGYAGSCADDAAGGDLHAGDDQGRDGGGPDCERVPDITPEVGTMPARSHSEGEGSSRAGTDPRALSMASLEHGSNAVAEYASEYAEDSISVCVCPPSSAYNMSSTSDRRRLQYSLQDW